MSLDGQLSLPLFIVLKESAVHFEQLVKQNLFRPNNVSLKTS